MGNILFGGPSMIIDRIIVAEPHRIEVGVCGAVGKEDNPYKTQVIRVNNGSLKSLTSFVETNNSLIYEFEDNTTLKLIKKENDIVYHIKSTSGAGGIEYTIEHTSNMHPLVRRMWKKISLKSEELDKISDFVKFENNE